LPDGALAGLVNNAALQVLGPAEQLTREDWRATLDVNLLAPFLWAQALLPELEAARGAVLNISSIHARLTKPGFVAYATSKAALSGMTRAMAVELGSRVRVNAIEPAAIDTPMLRAGFEGQPGEFARLAGCHPTGHLGSVEDVAQMALVLIDGQIPFLNAACVALDGGIGSALLDPACH
jgi:NAD(P)-dependent dehydrogenase (short-subunit alcohol dehydrogenase family)